MSEPLENITFVFTGNTIIDREEAKSRVVLLGGRSTGGVSGKTTYLVAGNEPGPSKMKKAKELKVKIISEEEFMEILKNAEEHFDSKIDINVREDNNLHNKTDLKNSIETKGIDTSQVSPCSSLSDMDIFSEEKLSTTPWTEKYRPKTPEEIIGNPSSISALEDFILSNIEGKTQKAALVSGPPGVGKTTAVHVLCKKYKIQLFEFNASDVRNKKAIQEKLQNISSRAIKTKFRKGQTRLIVMDEVDGMTSDRGGLGELNKIIKKSKIPIVCICNDRQHQQMQTLANNCVDIKFRKIDHRSILPRIKSILSAERKHLPDTVLNEIILQCSSDMRYILNTLQKNKDLSDAKNINVVKKEMNRNVFEITSEFFRKIPASKKIDLYFEDYTIIPLFVFENYCKSPIYGSGNSISEIARASDSISFGDIIDARIHGTQQEYNLMPYHAYFSCVDPTNNLKGSRVDFPSWLGQNSKAQKYKRLILEIKNHLKAKVDREDIRKYLMVIIYKKFTNYLLSSDSDSMKNAISVLVDLDLMKDDILVMGEFIKDESFKSVPTKVKSLLTRELKKLKRLLPYSIREISAEDD